MRIVVAGGAGFVGSHLTEALVGAGHDIVVLDNLCTGRRKNLDHLPESAVTFIETDISESVVVEGPVDAVYNLASPASPMTPGHR